MSELASASSNSASPIRLPKYDHSWPRSGQVKDLPFSQRIGRVRGRNVEIGAAIGDDDAVRYDCMNAVRQHAFIIDEADQWQQARFAGRASEDSDAVIACQVSVSL